VYQIKIEPEAQLDIQESIDWYNKRQAGLGRKFYSAIKLEFINLAKNPNYQIRYDKVRCIPIKKFPFLMHYTINQNLKTVIIRAIFHTSINPSNWDKR
jgi:plasmid stabilization system protein ParE